MIRFFGKVLAVFFALLAARATIAQTRPFLIGGETVLLERAEESVGAYLRAFRPNEATGRWEVDVVVTNGSTRILKAPIVLRFDAAGQIGAGIVGATLDSSGLPFLNFSPLVPGGEFLPGQELRKVTLSLGDARTKPVLALGVYSLPEVAPIPLLAMRTLAPDGTPLAGVAIEEIGPDQPRNFASGPSGWISLERGASVRGWRMNSPGMVSVLRLNPGPGNQRVLEAPSARFVPLASDGPTFFAPENIPAPIPAGWSPLGAALASSAAFSLELSEVLGVGRIAALARWDEAALGWRVVRRIEPGARTVSGIENQSGLIAVLRADAAPAAPPVAEIGEVLVGISTPAVPAGLMATGAVNPATRLASVEAPFVKAEATIEFASIAGALSSGLTAPCEIKEEYLMRDGSRRVLPSYRTILIGYQRGDGVAVSKFPLRPFQLLGGDELAEAVVRVKVLPPGTFEGGVFETAGGALANGTIRVSASSGDFARAEAAILREVALAPAGEIASAGLEFVTAFELSVGSAQPGRRLNVEPGSRAPSQKFVLARVVFDQGRHGFQPIQRFSSDVAGRMVSSEPVSGGLSGVEGDGLFVLFKIGTAEAVVSGVARDALGNARAGLVARRGPWTTFTDANGAFRLLAPVGSSDVTALDSSTGDNGTAAVEVPADLAPVQTIVDTAARGPRIVSTSPANTATAVARVASVVISFDKPMNAGSLLGEGVVLKKGDGAAVPASLSLNLKGTVATLLPLNPLDPSVVHTVAISVNVADTTGKKVEGPLSFSFTTESDLLDRVAGRLTIYEPEGGFAPLSGSAGSADPEAPVILVNETSGQTATVLSKVDGSFTNRIAAEVDDLISAVLVSRNGEQVTLNASRQIFKDGRVGLFSGGGTVEAPGENGVIEAIVEAGSINGKNIFELSPVSVAELQAQIGPLPAEDNTKILGGLKLAATGPALSQSVDFAIPINIADLALQPGESPTNRTFALCIPRVIDGVSVFEVVDNMEFENGRLVTHSPPFPGADATSAITTFTAIMMGFFPQKALVIGQVVRASEAAEANISDEDVRNGKTPSGKVISPLSGALVSADRQPSQSASLRAGAFLARANSRGFYALNVPFNVFDPDAIVLRARHPSIPNASVAKFMTPDGLKNVFSVGTVVNFIFRVPAGSEIDQTPPVITPAPPSANLPFGQSITFDFIIRDDQSNPALDEVEFIADGSFQIPNGQPVGTGSVSVSKGPAVEDGPLTFRVPVTFNVAVASQINVRAKARDAAGNVREQTLRFRFANAPEPVANSIQPGDPNDETPPRLVTMTPAKDDVISGPQILFRFNEPIDSLITNLALSVSIHPAVGMTPKLSPNQQELLLQLSDSKAGQEYTVLLHQAGVRDLSGNFIARGVISSFRTAPAPAEDLAETSGAVGSVEIGAFAFTLVRKGNEGELVSHQTGDISATQVGGRISLPFFPRVIESIGSYAYKRSANGPIETNMLVLAAGGAVGSDNPGQVVWIINVSNPTNLVRIASEIVSIDPAAVINSVKWRPPYFFMNEARAEGSVIEGVNLQAFILGANGFFQGTYFPGVDQNRDGDFVDAGDSLPAPERQTLFGLETATQLGANRIADDFDALEGGAFMAAILGRNALEGPRLQVVFHQGGFIGTGDAGSTEGGVVFPGAIPRRVLLDLGFPVQTPEGRKFIAAAVTLVDGGVEIYDLTNPIVPKLVNRIKLGTGQATALTLQRSGADEYMVGTRDGIFALQRSAMTLPADENGVSSGVTIVYSGPVVGRSAGASDLDFISATGGKARMLLRAPAIKVVRAPGLPVTNISSVIAQGESATREFLEGAFEFPFLIPAYVVRCPSDMPSPLGSATLPPNPNAHHYVIVRASGRSGSTINVAVESLDIAQQINAPLGIDYPPVLLGSEALRMGLSTMMPPTQALVARRLSDDPFSDLYNTYVTDPFVIVPQQLEAEDKTLLASDRRNRKAIWSGEFIRCSIDPLDVSALLEPFASEVVSRRYRPGVSRTYRSLRAEYRDSPNPSYFSAAPRHGGVDLQSGEFRHPQTDIFIEGREQPLSLTRLYESRSRFVGVFGRGWDFNLNLRLQEYPEELGPDFVASNCLPGQESATLVAKARDVMFFDGAGGAFRFHRIAAENGNEDQTSLYASDPAITEFLGLEGASRIAAYYESSQGLFSVLYKFTDGSWWMVGPTGIQMFFDATGRATKIHGRSKKSEILFSYRDDGKLDRVTGDRGIALSFGYFYQPPAVLNSGGLLDRVSERATDWGRIAVVRAEPTTANSSSVEYEYDDLGNLRKTKPSGSAETVHTYDQNDPNLLLSVGRGDGTEQPGVKIGYNPETALVENSTVDGEIREYSGAVVMASDRHAAGNSTVSLRRSDVTVEYQIDDRGRPQRFAGRPFGADDDGRVTTVADNLHQSTIVYDINNPVYRFRGNILRTERSSLSGGGKFVAETRYDGTALNRPESQTDLNGVATTFRYVGNEIIQTTGELVTRRAIQNDFNQTEQTILLGNGQLEVRSLFNAASPADQGMITGEQSGAMPASTRKRDTRGRIHESGEGTRVQSVHYNSDGQPDHLFGPGIPEVTTGYRNLLKETEVVISSGLIATETYSYADSRHKAHVTKLVSEETSLPAVITDYRYDANGRLKEMVVAGELTTLSYDGTRQTGLTAPGRNQTAAFDDSGRLTNMVQNGISADFVFDVNGRPQKITQQGADTFFEYDDSNGRLATRLKSKRIEADGEILLKESFTYDGAGRVKDVTSLGGRVKGFTWFPDNKVKSVTIDGVLLQEADRDTAGRVTRARLNDVQTTFGSFDPATGLPFSEDLVFLPSGRSLHRGNTYDANGRIKTTSLPIGSFEFGHDGFGHLNFRRDPDGVVTRKSFSPSGKMLSATFSDGTSVTHRYTPQRRLQNVVSPIGTMTFGYDVQGEAESITFPDGGVTEFKNRNDFFEPELLRLGGGEVAQTQSFDDAGRLESIVAGDDEMELSHDALGRRTESSLNGNSVTTLFNAHGEAVGEETDTGIWSMELDSRNRQIAENYPSGLRLEFGPDSFGLPTSVAAVGISAFQWIGAGIWSEIRLDGGLVLTRTYDEALRLKSIRYGNAAQFEYTLTPGGRVLAEKRAPQEHFDVFTRNNPQEAMRIVRFDFEAINDTGEGAIASLTNISFLNGELRGPAQGTLAEPRGYLPALTFAGQCVVSADDGAVEYNRRGSVTNTPLYVRVPGSPQLVKVQAALEYDGFGMLRRVTREDGVVVSYERDGLGRIILREVTGPAGLCEPGRRQYVWKGPRLLEERDEANGAFALTRRYIYVGDVLVIVQRAASPGGALVDFIPLLNLTGSICGYATRAGALVESIEYTAYGYPVYHSANDLTSGSLVGDTLLFHGTWFDPATGLYQMGQRNLHPILARFLQRDNAIFAESLALFSAFNGDPASRVDGRGALSSAAEAAELYDRGNALKEKADAAIDAGKELTDVLNHVRGYGDDEEPDFTAGGIATANFLGAVAELAGFEGDEKIKARVAEVTKATTMVKEKLEVVQHIGDILGEVKGLLDQRSSLKNFSIAIWARDPRNAPYFGNLHELGASFDLLNLKDLDKRIGSEAEGLLTEKQSMSREFLTGLQAKRDAYHEARFNGLLKVGQGVAALGKLYFDSAYKDDNRHVTKIAGGVLETASGFFDAIDAYQEAMGADDLFLTFKTVSGSFNQLTDVATSSAGRAALGAAFDFGFAAGKLAIVAFSDADVAAAYLQQVTQFEENGGWFTVAGGVLSTIGADEAAMFMQDLHDTALEDYVKPIVEERNRNVRRTEYYLKGLSAP